MKVFMSWSGQRSKATAELLHFWIKCVVQASQPWISTRGIDRGALWFSEINNELKDTTFGIICLTQENKNAPWILFESGALAKGLANSRVCTFLVDLETKDIRDPLAQFNHTLPDKAGLWNLVLTLNSSLESNRLDLNILEGVFETYWPQFEEKFARLKVEYPIETIIPPREEKDMLAEILESTRNLSQRLRTLESRSNATIHAKDSPSSIWKQAFTMLNPKDYTTRQLYIENASRHLMDGKSMKEVEAMLLNTPNVTPEIAEDILQTAMNSLFPTPKSSP